MYHLLINEQHRVSVSETYDIAEDLSAVRG